MSVRATVNEKVAVIAEVVGVGFLYLAVIATLLSQVAQVLA